MKTANSVATGGAGGHNDNLQCQRDDEVAITMTQFPCFQQYFYVITST